MRTAFTWVLLLPLGCGGFERPRPEEVSDLLKQLPAGESPFVRLKVRLNIDTPSLAGVFEGAIVVRTGADPAVRAQFFPDLGGKVIDLLARPGRIIGFFPVQNEGVDITLPDEARLHPLTLMGVTLLEHAVPVTAERVTGIREEADGPWYRLKALAPGVDLTIHPEPGGAVRRWSWKYGIHWTETTTARGVSVEAPRLSFRLEILERSRPDRLPESIFQLSLPAGIRRP